MRVTGARCVRSYVSSSDEAHWHVSNAPKILVDLQGSDFSGVSSKELASRMGRGVAGVTRSRLQYRFFPVAEDPDPAEDEEEEGELSHQRSSPREPRSRWFVSCT